MSEEGNWIVRSEPLTEQVYKYLKDSILSGRLEPGEKLVETKLAAALQISRSPVREAIRMLLAEQLLVMDNGTVSVFVPTVEDCRQVYELRIAIESKACELAVPNLTSDYQRRFEKNLQDTEKAVAAGNTDQLIELNSIFHNLILEVARNERFIKVMSEVSTLIRYYWRWVLQVSAQPTNIVAEHKGIYEALLTENIPLAMSRMTAHISRDIEILNSAQIRLIQSGS